MYAYTYNLSFPYVATSNPTNTTNPNSSSINGYIDIYKKQGVSVYSQRYNLSPNLQVVIDGSKNVSVNGFTEDMLVYLTNEGYVYKQNSTYLISRDAWVVFFD